MAQRNIKITRNYLMHPPGSVLIKTGNTKVICSVNFEAKLPAFLQNIIPEQGWLTAEYNMLPGATDKRFRRERSKVGGRTSEIQRLIGRCLRAIVDLTKIPGFTIYVDCDVIQADGGTRTASITGSCVALYDAFSQMLARGLISKNPFREWMAAVSVGIIDGEIVVDLCYDEDSKAEVDFNIVMTESDKIVEIQGTAETATFTKQDLDKMLELGRKSIKKLISEQKKSIQK